MPASPGGRSLADFEPLRNAELKLLESCRVGDECVISESRPTQEGKQETNTIRAAFLRYLILGGDEDHPVHEQGVNIVGAWIEGPLNLQGISSAGDISAKSCWFERAPVIRDTYIKGNLVLSRSRVPGLFGDRLTCNAGFFATRGFISEGEFRLLGAKIGGNLDFSGAIFHMPLGPGNWHGNALSLDRINVQGDMFLDDRFEANGQVRLVGATIGGSLLCRDSKFRGPIDNLVGASRDALIADRITIGGGVFFVGFSANGTVRLSGAKIGGDFVCDGAEFTQGREWNLNGQNLVVDGIFILRGSAVPASQITLASAHVGALADDADAWGQGLDLRGFRYDDIAGSGPIDAKTRLDWLDKQRPQYSGRDGDGRQFRPQPWMQLRKVLREAGHAKDAREVGIAFQTRRRRCGQIAGIGNILHYLYGLCMGYGLRPFRLFWFSVAIWLFCGVVYDLAAYRNVFVPASPEVYQTVSSVYFGSNWVFNPPFDGHYPAFHPFAYSLNVFLPVIDLGQQAAWEPIEQPFSPVWWKNLTQIFTDPGGRIQLIIWIEAMLGWAAGLVLVGFISSLAQKQDDV